MELTIDTTDINCPIVRISGVLLLKDVENFDVALQALVTIPNLNKLLIDMSALENWNDSAISSLLLFIEDWSKEEKLLAIFGLRSELIQDLDRKGMRDLLPIFNSEDDAKNSINFNTAND